MADLASATYLEYAESRLREAGERGERAMSNGYAHNRGELAKVASLIWDGAMDVLSALITLDGDSPSGRSSDLRQYARQVMTRDQYSLWRDLARLHNFQHKPNHSETVFRSSCRGTASLLELFNGRLPAQLQLPAECWEWLVGI